MIRFLLLQIRDPTDSMRLQEIGCFTRALRCNPEQIETHDLLTGPPSPKSLGRVDVVLLGGSGDYSAAGEGEWLETALDVLRDLVDRRKPTFASCWGFQAFARALGGQVIHDLPSAEIGTIDLQLTLAGKEDPVFGPLDARFRGQAGHEDRVLVLPEGAVLLASSEKVAHQAYRLDGLPIYATQFHPELNRENLLDRLRIYPTYVQRIAEMSFEEFEPYCFDTPKTEALLRRFVEHVLEG